MSLPNYGFDQTDNRHGGASLIQPLQTISTVTRTNLDPVSIFGGSIMTVTGIGVEPSFQETGVHGNIGGNNFGTQASFASAADYFSEGENTPPYFGGFNYMQFCGAADSTTTSWNSCPVTWSFLALGQAEYLDVDNWGRSPNGIAPEQQAVFWETLYHQNVYAEISGAAANRHLLGGQQDASAGLPQPRRLVEDDLEGLLVGFRPAGRIPGARLRARHLSAHPGSKRTVSRHRQRGQVLPVWAMGIVAMLIVTMAVVRYSDMVRWQVRAQNAADAAAQAIVALQTQQFNEMEMTLYAADVEEYRIRNILYALELTAYGNGGCRSTAPARLAMRRS